MSAELITDLERVVGPEHVLTEPDLRAGYEIDWTRRFSGSALAVVRPADTAQTARVVETCARHRVPMIPQGGNTGLVGGGVPALSGPRPIVVSTSRLTAIEPIDSLGGQITVGAGVTLAALESVLLGSGRQFGVDLAARASATLGGMAATNAGGTRVVRYGTMRSNVVGLESVLPDGRILAHLGGLAKDNTGYHLTSLFTGSEGTLGIITRLRLGLVPHWPDTWAVAVACASWADALVLSGEVRRHVHGVEVLEAVDRAGVDTARDVLGLSDPLPGAAVTLVIVWAGHGQPHDSLGRLVGDRPHVVGPPRRLLEIRDRQSEAIARLGIPHKFDVSLPVQGLVDFTERAPRLLGGGARSFIFGHLGDGNLHLNVVGPPPDDEGVDAAIYELVASLGGSISAEHGIGRAKASWLPMARSAVEIDTMRRIKESVDPLSLMNPGVIFPV
jgi:FAD/FMN-containing dehydrogenase